MRRLVYGLRPPALDDLGLGAALAQFAELCETTELRFSLQVDEPPSLLPAAVETAAYRIAQEAMTNVVRHAQATQAILRLYMKDNCFVVEVRDDGQGLPPHRPSGVGLQTMRERTAELNGRLLIHTLPEGGVLVQASLPLEDAGD